MKRAKFTSIAEADLREIAYYIARRNPERAMTFVDEIIAHCHKIANHPGIGRARSGLGSGIRSMPYGRYVISIGLSIPAWKSGMCCTAHAISKRNFKGKLESCNLKK